MRPASSRWRCSIWKAVAARLASPRRLQAQVYGYAQGVNFRWYTRRNATRLGLKGYVRNCEDGTVEVVAEGEQDALQELL
ncbi:MAG: acylphosphatase, partial [Armatimonadota bacterium]